jgi:hypothetical protein
VGPTGGLEVMEKKCLTPSGIRTPDRPAVSQVAIQTLFINVGLDRRNRIVTTGVIRLWDVRFSAPYGTWDVVLNPSGCCSDTVVAEDVDFLGCLPWTA